MTACLFGTYDREHSANRLLRAALATAGWRVIECHEPLWEETREKGARYFGAASLARLGARYAAAARRLARRSRHAVWHLGVEPEFLPARPARPTPRRVLFYGRHLPLHGVDTIVAAAARLGEHAEFELIGRGPERARSEQLARRLGARVGWRD